MDNRYHRVTSATAGDLSDSDAEEHLMELLADMDDDEIEALAAVAETIHDQHDEGM